MVVTQIHGNRQIQSATITNDRIADDQITNAKINSAAAIAYSKLALANSIVNADIATAAAIAYSKLNLTGSIVSADLATAFSNTLILTTGTHAFAADQSMGGFKLTNLGNGTAASDAVNKSQLDSAVAGLSWKAPVDVATTTVLTGTMIADNGTPATGQRTYNTTTKTITWFAGEGPTSIDGVSLSNGYRVLVKDETSTSGPSSGEGRKYNGIYVRTSADVWTRTTDSDASAEFEGAAVFVQQGSVNANRGYTQTTDGVTLDSSNIVWVVFSATNGDANTLDGLDSTQFLRSDVSSALTTGATLTVNSGAFVNFAVTSALKIGGTAVTTSAAELNLLTGKTGTVWTSTNDGTGSGLDADLLDGLDSTDFARLTASSSLLSGNTLTIASGAFINFAVNTGLKIGGTSLTATVTQLNALGTFAIRETPTGTVNGSNDTFTLANTPTSGQEEVYVNGVQQDAGGANDYTISSAVITFTAGAIPQTGSKVRVSYRY